MHFAIRSLGLLDSFTAIQTIINDFMQTKLKKSQVIIHLDSKSEEEDEALSQFFELVWRSRRHGNSCSLTVLNARKWDAPKEVL